MTFSTQFALSRGLSKKCQQNGNAEWKMDFLLLTQALLNALVGV